MRPRIPPGSTAACRLGGVAMRAVALGMVVRGIMGLAGWLAVGAPTQAADVPAIVIPGKRGVPVVINGYDASYCVVESDWGLDRPGHLTPNIIDCPLRNPPSRHT